MVSSMTNPSDEIKSRLDIVDILREYIQLKPAGVNFRTNCPFHREKTPSFIVSPEKQIWHCFGCGKGGDIFTFVMEMEGLSFVEALRLLAPKAGVELKKMDAGLASKRNRLLDIVKLSASYYHKMLLESPAAASARAYLERRGFSADTIERWQLGLSPDSWDNLFNYLRSKGFNEEEIFESGMSVKKEGRPGYYDRFRGRIMFPICDGSGNPVAFSARVSPEREATEKMGKYINSPATLIYDKSRILFGLDKAKQAIKQAEAAIIVEGQADVITAHQHGFANAVAASGTALTRDQVALLKRYTANLLFSFDMDSAGESAVERGTREALKAEMSARVIVLIGAKDPDECIRDNPEEWRRAVAAAKPVMQYHLDRATEGQDLSDISVKRQVAAKLLSIIGTLANRIEQDGWLKKLSQIIDVSENILRETLASAVKSQSQRDPETAADREAEPLSARRSREELISELLLALLIKFPEHIPYAASNLLAEQLVGEDNIRLYKNLLIYYNRNIESGGSADDFGDLQIRADSNQNNQIDYKDFRAWLARSGDRPADNFSLEDFSEQSNNNSQPTLLDRLALLAEKDFYSFDSGSAKNEIIKTVKSLKKNYLSGQLKEIEKLISQSEKSGDKALVNKLLEEFKVLTDEFKTVDQF